MAQDGLASPEVNTVGTVGSAEGVPRSTAWTVLDSAGEPRSVAGAAPRPARWWVSAVAFGSAVALTTAWLALAVAR